MKYEIKELLRKDGVNSIKLTAQTDLDRKKLTALDKLLTTPTAEFNALLQAQMPKPCPPSPKS